MTYGIIGNVLSYSSSFCNAFQRLQEWLRDDLKTGNAHCTFDVRALRTGWWVVVGNDVIKWAAPPNFDWPGYPYRSNALEYVSKLELWRWYLPEGP